MVVLFPVVLADTRPVTRPEPIARSEPVPRPEPVARYEPVPRSEPVARPEYVRTPRNTNAVKKDPFTGPPKPFAFRYGVADVDSGSNFDHAQKQDSTGVVTGQCYFEVTIFDDGQKVSS